MLALKLPLLCAAAAIGPQAIISATVKIDQPSLLILSSPSVTGATALGPDLFLCPASDRAQTRRVRREPVHRRLEVLRRHLTELARRDIDLLGYVRVDVPT